MKPPVPDTEYLQRQPWFVRLLHRFNPPTTYVLGFTGACVLLATFIFAHSQLHGPPCLFRTFLHLPCPGCGMTRSLISLWHADPAVSFRYHPMGILIFSGCILSVTASLIYALCPPWRKGVERFSELIIHPRLTMAGLVMLIAIWAVRFTLAFTGNRFFLW